jgi:hypothetical protein
MIRSRITLAHVAALGGLLGAALLSVAVAVADNYAIVPDPSSIETITGFYGPDGPPPAVPESFQGYQLFDVVDTTTHKTIGTFDADEAYTASLYGGPNREFLVTSDVSGPVGIAANDVPPVGSVIDISQTASGTSTYSDYPTVFGDVVRESGFGGTGLPGYFGFYDAAKGIAHNIVDHNTVALPDGDSVVVHPGSPEVFTSIDGYPPYDVAVQGDQLFSVVNSHGVTVGTFEADVTNTSDTLGNYTEALVVTQDVSGTPGTAEGDVLPVGSVINAFYYVYGTQSIYSDLPTPSGDVISDISKSFFGTTSSATTFDAVKALSTYAFPVPSENYELVPVSPLQVAGVNGLPPSDVAIQGYQQLNVVDATTHAQLGIVDADVNTDYYSSGSSDEAFLITSDVSGTPGISTGEIPPVGSVFEVVPQSNGSETVYSDLASPSGDVISQYLVTSSGDSVQSTTLDLAAGLAADHFYVPAF